MDMETELQRKDRHTKQRTELSSEGEEGGEEATKEDGWRKGRSPSCTERLNKWKGHQSSTNQKITKCNPVDEARPPPPPPNCTVVVVVVFAGVVTHTRNSQTQCASYSYSSPLSSSFLTISAASPFFLLLLPHLLLLFFFFSFLSFMRLHKSFKSFYYYFVFCFFPFLLSLKKKEFSTRFNCLPKRPSHFPTGSPLLF